MSERIERDTDLLLIKYAPLSRDVDVCISNMQLGIEQLERERDEALERCCKLVIEASLSTGHAETVEDLMREVLWQVDELRRGYGRLSKSLSDK